MHGWPDGWLDKFYVQLLSDKGSISKLCATVIAPKIPSPGFGQHTPSYSNHVLLFGCSWPWSMAAMQKISLIMVEISPNSINKDEDWLCEYSACLDSDKNGDVNCWLWIWYLSYHQIMRLSFIEFCVTNESDKWTRLNALVNKTSVSEPWFSGLSPIN